MIQLSTIPVENIEKEASWKEQLQNSRISTKHLLQYLGLEEHPLADGSAESLFELIVPPEYLRKIEPGNPFDPLLLQVLPQASEFTQLDGYLSDPLEEQSFSPVKGLIHKYRNRALLICNSACAINCRYCFRRNFPYSEHRQSKSDWDNIIRYIRENEALDEVILSGGEPLILNNKVLFALLERLDDIQHIKRIRIHTRMLTTIPARADQEFLIKLRKLNSQVVIITHCNHANELGHEHIDVFADLKEAGTTLLNQSVLLRNINDTPETLADLSHKLFEIGILPYYLFILDKVKGASHFDLDLEQAQQIHKELQGQLPGYLVPRLALEEPGKHSKTLIN